MVDSKKFSDEFGPAPFKEAKLSVKNGAGCQIFSHFKV
jgi:hypothetical protein